MSISDIQHHGHLLDSQQQTIHIRRHCVSEASKRRRGRHRRPEEKNCGNLQLQRVLSKELVPQLQTISQQQCYLTRISNPNHCPHHTNSQSNHSHILSFLNTGRVVSLVQAQCFANEPKPRIKYSSVTKLMSFIQSPYLITQRIWEDAKKANDVGRAVYEARAKEANANPLQLVNDLDIEKKIELSNNALSQLKKCFGVLDALGYSFMFAAINEDTNATFKQITGTPAKIADDQYKKSGDGIGFANASLSAGGKDASSWYSSRAMNKSPPATRPGT